MMQKALLVVASAVVAAKEGSKDGIIYIIRHGEKNSDGDLSSTGQKRAKYIASIFPGSEFSRPGAIFAGHYGGGTPQRTKHTVQPTADKQGLSVDNSISNSDHSGAARAMLSKVASGHTVLAAWEHCNIRDTCYKLASQSMCDNAFKTKFSSAIGDNSTTVVGVKAASSSARCDWWEECSGCSDPYDGVVSFTVKSGKVTAVEHLHEDFFSPTPSPPRRRRRRKSQGADESFSARATHSGHTTFDEGPTPTSPTPEFGGSAKDFQFVLLSLLPFLLGMKFAAKISFYAMDNSFAGMGWSEAVFVALAERQTAVWASAHFFNPSVIMAA